MVHGLLRRLGLFACPALAAISLCNFSASAQVIAAASPPLADARPDNHAATALGGDRTRTRFVIGLDHAVTFHISSLSNPNRVVIELPEVKLQLPAMADGAPAVGLVKSFRGGEAGSGRNRIVIDVTQAVVVESAKLDKGRDGKSHRLVLDIVPVESSAKKAALKTQPFALGAAGMQPPLPKPALSPAQRAAKAFRPILVIDPGHGGHDSGAARHGTVEKEVVLAFSKVLRDKLMATGRYRVLMTRDNDTFVELDERRAFAERNQANLFIAVHADYAQSRARGATIFSLRDRVAEELKRSAVGHARSANFLSGKQAAAIKEANGGEVGEVEKILADLEERDISTTKERTSVFSKSLIEYMGAETEMRNNPDQQAAFRVLKTAQFPSVLIELAYVTNKEDAENLKSNAWRDKVADSILTAVDNYFTHQLARLPM